MHKKFYELPHTDIHLNVIGPYLQKICKITSPKTKPIQPPQIESDPVPLLDTTTLPCTITKSPDSSPTFKLKLRKRTRKSSDIKKSAHNDSNSDICDDSDKDPGLTLTTHHKRK